MQWTAIGLHVKNKTLRGVCWSRKRINDSAVWGSRSTASPSFARKSTTWSVLFLLHCKKQHFHLNTINQGRGIRFFFPYLFIVTFDAHETRSCSCSRLRYSSYKRAFPHLHLFILSPELIRHGKPTNSLWCSWDTENPPAPLESPSQVLNKHLLPPCRKRPHISMLMQCFSCTERITSDLICLELLRKSWFRCRCWGNRGSVMQEDIEKDPESGF